MPSEHRDPVPAGPDFNLPGEDPDTQERISRGRAMLANTRGRLGSFAVIIVFVALIVAFSVALPETFPTQNNLVAILSSQAVLLILAVAVTMPLRSGDFDLSVGAVAVAAASVVAVMSAKHHAPTGLAIVCGIAVGAVVGAINGGLIVRLEIDAFVVTLATMTIVTGLGLALTESTVISGVSHDLHNLTQTHFLGLPAMVFYGWIIALVLWYVYRYTPFGRHLLFVGGNSEAARLAGVSVGRTRFAAFFFCSVLAAIAGVVLVGSLGAIDPTIAPQYLLQPYAAAFLGTAVIQVGRFNILGAVIALYLLAVSVSGLQLLGAASWVSEVFNGGALLAAILFARFTRSTR